LAVRANTMTKGQKRRVVSRQKDEVQQQTRAPVAAALHADLLLGFSPLALGTALSLDFAILSMKPVLRKKVHDASSIPSCCTVHWFKMTSTSWQQKGQEGHNSSASMSNVMHVHHCILHKELGGKTLLPQYKTTGENAQLTAVLCLPTSSGNKPQRPLQSVASPSATSDVCSWETCFGALTSAAAAT
jgi:hypothetical protein